MSNHPAKLRVRVFHSRKEIELVRTNIKPVPYSWPTCDKVAWVSSLLGIQGSLTRVPDQYLGNIFLSLNKSIKHILGGSLLVKSTPKYSLGCGALESVASNEVS